MGLPEKFFRRISKLVLPPTLKMSEKVAKRLLLSSERVLD
jgi:hypothetical protein